MVSRFSLVILESVASIRGKVVAKGSFKVFVVVEDAGSWEALPEAPLKRSVSTGSNEKANSDSGISILHDE
jgi:hypothetical protein